MSITKLILRQLVGAVSEPLVLVRANHTDWPVVFANEACDLIGGVDIDQPFAEVIEGLLGRDVALEVSEAIRSGDEAAIPIEMSGREYLLALRPFIDEKEQSPAYYGVYWRAGGSASMIGSSESHQALLKAKRRIRDLLRDDPVTGLLNDSAFREVLDHDWAVASREDSAIALVVFRLDDFDTYLEVFGKHAADSALRRVGQAVRRCLRRASDVVGRMDGNEIAVISHAADEDSVREFAGRISASVRDLGLHHPRSSVSKFVTVKFAVAMSTQVEEGQSAGACLDGLLGR
ncbi:MAG: GGDEF domain-containing protein [Pseudomonadota bacterium]